MSTFKRFEEDDIVRANPTEVTVGIWSGDTGSLTKFYTSSAQAQSVSGEYYFDVYNMNPSSSLAEKQFVVAFGSSTGGGNFDLAHSDTATLSTKAIYSQYRNLLLAPDDAKFTFAGNVDADDIYVINLQRARLKEELDPGNWMLVLSGSSGSVSFIDDSQQTLGAQFGKSGPVFNIVVGTLTGVSGSTITSTGSATHGGYGLVYPTLGIMVFNAVAIAEKVGFVLSAQGNGVPFYPRSQGYNNGCEHNQEALFTSMVLGGDFQARSAETVSSTHYWARLRNKEFNYSNNPTFFDESNGVIKNQTFIQDPRVYVTTIGLLNDSNEVLAIAKLSKPVQKSFDKELLVKIRLDF